MKNMKTDFKKTSTAGLVLRHEIVRMVLSNPGKVIKIPSAQQLAIKFGYSQRTAASGLAELVDEGWIIGKKGVGYFSNPQKRQWKHNVHRRIAAIAWSDTKDLCYEYNTWALETHIGMDLPPHIAFPRHLMVNAITPESLQKELQYQEMDALVWGDPPEKWKPVLSDFHAKGLPIITVLCKAAGVPMIGIDTFATGREIAKLIDWSRPGIVLWGDQSETHSSDIRRGFLSAMPEPERFRLYPDPDVFPSELEKLLRNGTPPLAICGYATAIDALFAQYDFDPMHDTQRIAEWSFVRRNDRFHGITHRFPYEEIGRSVADMLTRLFNHQSVTDIILSKTVEKK